ncbi:MAG: hypothetical protein V4732_09095 [Pseudomonadota bacterium]
MFMSYRLTFLIRLVCLFVLAALLGACQTLPEPEAEVLAPEVIQPVIAVAPILTEQQKHINSLLSEADYALSQNKLLNPISDNAHDRYRSVLLMDATNERAKVGLQTIALRYVELARIAAVRGNLSEAQSLIRYASGIDNNAVVQDAAETIRKQIASTPPAKPAKAYQAAEGEYLLDSKLLQAKDSQVITQLSQVAQKAKQTGDFVLIVARSDAEGRWIYQQLRSAVPGFLVRGDIKIGQPARVKLVASIE